MFLILITKIFLIKFSTSAISANQYWTNVGFSSTNHLNLDYITADQSRGYREYGFIKIYITRIHYKNENIPNDEFTRININDTYKSFMADAYNIFDL